MTAIIMMHAFTPQTHTPTTTQTTTKTTEKLLNNGHAPNRQPTDILKRVISFG